MKGLITACGFVTCFDSCFSLSGFNRVKGLITACGFVTFELAANTPLPSPVKGLITACGFVTILPICLIALWRRLVKGLITACGFVTFLKAQLKGWEDALVKGLITACGFVTPTAVLVQNVVSGEMPDYRLRFCNPTCDR